MEDARCLPCVHESLEIRVVSARSWCWWRRPIPSHSPCWRGLRLGRVRLRPISESGGKPRRRPQCSQRPGPASPVQPGNGSLDDSPARSPLRRAGLGRCGRCAHWPQSRRGGRPFLPPAGPGAGGGGAGEARSTASGHGAHAGRCRIADVGRGGAAPLWARPP